MAHANYYLRNDKEKDTILFLATNTDASYVTKNGHYPGTQKLQPFLRLYPWNFFWAFYPGVYVYVLILGTGTIVTAVAYGCQRKPIIVGKPEPLFMDCIKKA